MTDADPIRNVCNKLAGAAFRRGIPLHVIIRMLWDEYDRLFGWEIMTQEDKDGLIRAFSVRYPVPPAKPEGQQ
jgi:hypothetical protein